MAKTDPAVTLWGLASLLIGASLIAFGGSQGEASPWIASGGLALAMVGALGFLRRRWIAEVVEDSRTERAIGRPIPTLFMASFVALFVEVMLIRYTGSQFRVFSFYKNVPLIGCYLGMGIGCFLRGGSSKHVLLFLMWLVPISVVLSLGSIAVSTPLGQFASLGSTEHILGDFVEVNPSAWTMFASQAVMGGFAVAIFVAMTLLFIPLGRLLGEAFKGIAQLPGYTVNIFGSLIGVAVFTALSYAWMPPWVWILVGLAPLFWWLDDSRSRKFAAILAALSVAAVVPSFGTTVWSPYQKLVGRSLEGQFGNAYLIDISDVFYQVAVDLREPAIQERYPNYKNEYDGLPPGGRVLIVGAGSGNDVSGALHAGAGHVDAVDIDPAIVEMGRVHHPEKPYDDPRVSVVINDARNAFHDLPKGSYDTVIFGLLDSHTQLGISSVRLDNYVFTAESIATARRLLKPGGRIALTAVTWKPWFKDRLVALVSKACGKPADVRVYAPWVTYSCVPEGPVDIDAISKAADADGLPTDDWPFLYLPVRAVPFAYLIVVALLMATSAIILRVKGVQIGKMSPARWHMFFMGAAFLLMEVHAINRLALVFGTTWVVSAITISLVLIFIMLANLIVIKKPVPYAIGYGGLFLSLIVSWWIEPGIIRDAGLVPSMGYALVHIVPIFFAALVFARSFTASEEAGPALGANMLGAAMGGWVEYASMATGIRMLVLLALGMYVLSLIALLRSKASDAPAAASPA
ncbi:MAG: methyltransferase domain-containing protein [Polyangiaceae bacterium]